MASALRTAPMLRPSTPSHRMCMVSRVVCFSRSIVRLFSFGAEDRCGRVRKTSRVRVVGLLAGALLCFPTICQAAFFARQVGEFLVLEKEISYRTDFPAGTGLDQAMTATGTWVLQA